MTSALLAGSPAHRPAYGPLVDNLVGGRKPAFRGLGLQLLLSLGELGAALSGRGRPRPGGTGERTFGRRHADAPLAPARVSSRARRRSGAACVRRTASILQPRPDA